MTLHFARLTCRLAVALALVGGSVFLSPIGAQPPVAAQTATDDLLAGHTASVATAAAPWVLTPPAGTWDLSRRAAVAVTIHNTGGQPAPIEIRAENAGATGMRDTVRARATLAAGATQTVVLRLTRRPQDPTYAPLAPYFMYEKNVAVRDNTVDPAAIARLVVSVEGGSVAVTGAAATGEGQEIPPPFFPFVDKYGQYIHSDWPGKIYDDRDFAARLRQEDDEMRSFPGPQGWDGWGGWKSGPHLAATGHFRTTRHENKWWLVDPDGYLFFSYGPTGVGFGEGTPITGRENWFAALPPHANSPLARYWGNGKGATYMFYKDKPYQTYDFSAAAAERKYGPEWRTVSVDRLHNRLRNWGFNTLANWSSPDVAARRQTPYVVAIHYGGPWLYRMPDAFAPAFEQALRDRLAQETGKSAGDPWCLGYFVDNELWWGPGQRGENVAQSVLKAAAGSASKQVFIADLQAKYQTIDRLNAAWGAAYPSWDGLRETQALPATPTAAYHDDCGVFGLKFADHYFATVRRLVKAAAPDNLYLGCRFHGHIDTPLVQIAARYADVVSYNVYEKQPGDRLNRFIGAVDAPFIVGEFGVGSDPLQTPLRGAQWSEDPDSRARQMQQYIRGAFVHPLLVGAHFFQFRDQPLTGRPDGEAVLRGFVDTTDTPHFDLVQANRRIAYEMYPLRAGTRTAQATP